MEISIRTVVIGCSFGGGDSATRVEVPDAGLPARALIARKVEADVAAFNKNRHRLYGREYRPPEALIDDEQAAGDPARHGSYAPVAAADAVQGALEGFSEGAFRITVDERHVASLEEIVRPTPRSDIVFVRLMPFISG